MNVRPLPTTVDSSYFRGGADAHLASFANRSTALVVLAPGAEGDRALGELLVSWKSRRGCLRDATLVVAGRAEAVRAHCVWCRVPARRGITP